MERNQELLEKKEALERRIKTLKRKLKDTKEELLQVEEELRSDNNIINYERNIKENAERFQMRIMEEMERNLSISEQTARTKMYKEIQEIKKLSEEDHTRLRKITSKAERFYRVIEKVGGKEKIKHLSGISVDAITKL